MKKQTKKYSINYQLIKIPFLIFLISLLGFFSILWLYSDYFFFTSYHQDKIFTSINNKKDDVNKWFIGLKKEFETTAEAIARHYKTNTVIENQKQTKGKSPSHKPSLEEDIKKLLTEKENKDSFNFVSLISKEGKIIASTSVDVVGSDISQNDIFRNIISKIKETSFVGFWKDGNKEYEMDMICPIKDEKGNVIAFLHGIINLNPLQSIITHKRAMSYEIVDKDGYILLSSNLNNKGMKYSSQFTNNLDKISLFDNTLIALVRLKELNLYLLQKTEIYYAIYPLIEVCAIILGFVILIFFFFIYQSIVIKRQISSPINRVIGLLKSPSSGLQTLKIKGNFPKEIDNLIDEIDRIIYYTTSKDETKTEEKLEREVPKTEIMNDHSDNISSKDKYLLPVLKSSLNKIMSQNSILAGRLSNIQNKDEDLVTLKKDIFTLLKLIETILFCLKDDTDKREFIFSEVLNKIDDTIKGLNFSPFIELIVEHDSDLKDKIVSGNKDALMQVITNLLSSSLNSTNRGTITLLSSLVEDESGQLIIFNISDTGYGYDISELDAIRSGNDTSNLSLMWAFMISELYDIHLTIDSIKGKGTTTTVVINTHEK